MKTTRSALGHDDEEQDENYFISLSDLMSGMLFIFIILTAALALNYSRETIKYAAAKQMEEDATEKETEAIAREKETAKREHDLRLKATEQQKSAQKLQGDLDAADKKLAEANQQNKEAHNKARALESILSTREEKRQKILHVLARDLKVRGLNVNIDETSTILRLPESLLFDSGKDEPTEDGKKAIEILADLMMPVMEAGSQLGSDKLKWEAIYIEGHTDNVPISGGGRFRTNWELSSARAIRIYHDLTQRQAHLGDLKNPNNLPILGISGYEAKRPVSNDNTEDGKRLNRRIDIRFVMASLTDAEIREIEGKLNQSTAK